jgi:hypothetical protein
MPYYKGQNCKVEISKRKNRKPFKLIILVKPDEVVPPWYGLIYYRWNFSGETQGYATIIGLNIIFRLLYTLYVYIRCGSKSVPPDSRIAYRQGRMDERAELERTGRLKP